MPVYGLCCNDCGHEFRSFVLVGTELPKRWPCASCGGANAERKADSPALPHPWDGTPSKPQHVYGCLCCF